MAATADSPFKFPWFHKTIYMYSSMTQVIVKKQYCHEHKTSVILQFWLNSLMSYNYIFVYKEMECNTLHRGFWEDKDIFWFSWLLCGPQQFMSLFDLRGWFGWKLDHMGWFALLLVKFGPPGWFYFVKYASESSQFWGWEQCFCHKLG